MKIGLVLPYSLSYYGGVQKHVLGLYREFKKRSHRVKIFVPRQKLEEKYKNKDILLIGGAINFPFESTVNLSFGLTVGGVPLNEYFKQTHFDILHFHNPTAPFLPWQILQVSKTINIATFHADLVDHKFYGVYSGLIGNIYDYLLPKINGFIAVSESAKHSLTSLYPKAKVTVIPNGIDIEHFAEGKPIKKYQDGKFNLLSVGRLDERKGIPYLLKAFKKLKKKFPRSLRLILVGDGPEKTKIQNLIKKLKITKGTELIGEVSEKDLPGFYKSGSLLVAPATHGESFGLILLEAMAAGLPIVAAANRGYQEVLKEVRNDCLVPPKDTTALVKKIADLIHNERKRIELKEWGFKKVENYSWPMVAKEILDFYAEVCKRKQNR